MSLNLCLNELLIKVLLSLLGWDLTGNYTFQCHLWHLLFVERMQLLTSGSV